VEFIVTKLQLQLQQSPGRVSGTAPSGQRGHSHSIWSQGFFFSGQLGQQSPGRVSGTAPSGQRGHSHSIWSQGFFFSGQLGQQSPGFVLGRAPSGQRGQPHSTLSQGFFISIVIPAVFSSSSSDILGKFKISSEVGSLLMYLSLSTLGSAATGSDLAEMRGTVSSPHIEASTIALMLSISYNKLKKRRKKKKKERNE